MFFNNFNHFTNLNTVRRSLSAKRPWGTLSGIDLKTKCGIGSNPRLHLDREYSKYGVVIPHIHSGSMYWLEYKMMRRESDYRIKQFVAVSSCTLLAMVLILFFA